MRKITLVLSLFLSVALAGQGLLPVGSEAKKFLILDNNGKRIGLRDYIGPQATEKPKLLVLSFWSLGCLPCRKEMPLLQAWAAQHPEAKLLFINVDPKSEQEKVAAFTIENKLQQNTLLLDFYQATGKNYNVCTESSCNVPALYAIDALGTIRLAISGYNERNDLVQELNTTLAQLGQAQPIRSTASTENAKKYQVLHDVLKNAPLEETAARNNISKEALIEIFKEVESAAKNNWNLP